MLTVRRPVFVPIKCSGTLCISSAAVARLMCQQHPSLHLSSLPHSFQGNMCAGILPQLRQGLGRSAVGTECGKNGGSGPLSFPHRHSASFSLALVGEATSLLPHPYCNPSSHIYSPYILFLLHILITENLVCPLFQYAEWPLHYFFSHPLNQPPRSAIAFGLNSPSFSEVHGFSGPPPHPPLMPLQLYTAGLSGGEPGTPP